MDRRHEHRTDLLSLGAASSQFHMLKVRNILASLAILEHLFWDHLVVLSSLVKGLLEVFGVFTGSIPVATATLRGVNYSALVDIRHWLLFVLSFVRCLNKITLRILVGLQTNILRDAGDLLHFVELVTTTCMIWNWINEWVVFACETWRLLNVEDLLFETRIILLLSLSFFQMALVSKVYLDDTCCRVKVPHDGSIRHSCFESTPVKSHKLMDSADLLCWLWRQFGILLSPLNFCQAFWRVV